MPMGGPADRLPELAVQPILWFNYVETPKVLSNARLLRAAAQERPASPRVRPPQKRSTLGVLRVFPFTTKRDL